MRRRQRGTRVAPLLFATAAARVPARPTYTRDCTSPLPLRRRPRRFEFVPALQRMGVIVRVAPTDALLSLVKGSPETVLALSVPASVPRDAAAVLRSYAHRGFRVLAAGYKAYDGPDPNSATDASPDALRAGAEAGLTFLGFIVLVRDATGGTRSWSCGRS